MYNESQRHQKRVVTTQDSSDTLYSYEFNEHYHSTKEGAFIESLHKHIVPAFTYNTHKKHLRILDICFGLGYNTLTTLYYIREKNLDVSVEIYSPEFDLELIRSLKDFSYPKKFERFHEIIEAVANELEYHGKGVDIKVLLGDARDSIPKLTQKFNIVYQDAFSPKSNPLLWTKEYFGDIAQIITDDGVLTTYSTALSTRLALFENGLIPYLYQDGAARNSTVASFSILKNITPVDMNHKIKTNPNAHPLYDKEFS